MINATRKLIGRGFSRSRALLGTLLVAGMGVGCDSMLEVDLPGQIPSDALNNPSLAPVLVQGAIGDFECAHINYITATALLTDELIDSTGWIAVTMWDQRRILPNNGNLSTASCTATGYGIFRTLQTARFQAEDVAARLAGWTDAEVPNRIRLLATATAYAGNALTLLGEGFCEMTVDGGPLMTPTQVLQLAETRFTTAIGHAQAAGDAPILNMARVGRARVRLDLGDLAGAAADAQLVPQGFVANSTYSTAATRRWNLANADNHSRLWISVHPTFRGLVVDGVPDTRVPVRNANRRGHDGVTDLWLQDKYPTMSSPVPIASWRQAQLIIAEASGGVAAVDAINRLRTAAGLPAFSSTSQPEITAQVLEERRRELYLEGHRINDLLRHGLPFPEGVTHKDVAYGQTTCLPLPLVERQSNPNLAGL